MSGRHPFRELTKNITPERRRRIDAMKRELLAERFRSRHHQLSQVVEGEDQ